MESKAIFEKAPFKSFGIGFTIHTERILAWDFVEGWRHRRVLYIGLRFLWWLAGVRLVF